MSPELTHGGGYGGLTSGRNRKAQQRQRQACELFLPLCNDDAVTPRRYNGYTANRHKVELANSSHETRNPKKMQKVDPSRPHRAYESARLCWYVNPYMYMFC